MLAFNLGATQVNPKWSLQVSEQPRIHCCHLTKVLKKKKVFTLTCQKVLQEKSHWNKTKPGNVKLPLIMQLLFWPSDPSLIRTWSTPYHIIKNSLLSKTWLITILISPFYCILSYGLVTHVSLLLPILKLKSRFNIINMSCSTILFVKKKASIPSLPVGVGSTHCQRDKTASPPPLFSS